MRSTTCSIVSVAGAPFNTALHTVCAAQDRDTSEEFFFEPPKWSVAGFAKPQQIVEGDLGILTINLKHAWINGGRWLTLNHHGTDSERV
jgi:hypothetical protein